MNYIDQNKEAWEEAFEHRRDNWGDNNYIRLLNENLPFFDPAVKEQLKHLDLKGKKIAQFCCNNGRELLSLMQAGPEYGVGFDIAENIIAQAGITAEKAHITNCDFVSCNILDISDEYLNSFDFIFFTIGAITWFCDLMPLFKKVSECLKEGGLLLIHDSHPFINMMPFPGEEDYDEKHTNRIAYSYFRTEPWIENQGMSYMSKQYKSKTFISYTHTLSSIINSICSSGMAIKKFDEFDYDVGLTEIYNGLGYPLSYLLIAQK